MGPFRGLSRPRIGSFWYSPNLHRTDTPTPIRSDPGNAVYWLGMRRRNDDIHSLTSQPEVHNEGVSCVS